MSERFGLLVSLDTSISSNFNHLKTTSQDHFFPTPHPQMFLIFQIFSFQSKLATTEETSTAMIYQTLLNSHWSNNRLLKYAVILPKSCERALMCFSVKHSLPLVINDVLVSQAEQCVSYHPTCTLFLWQL